jgi:hypothetical protein
MTNILLGIYFLVLGAVGLFGLQVDPKALALLALVLGILLLISPYTFDRKPV